MTSASNAQRLLFLYALHHALQQRLAAGSTSVMEQGSAWRRSEGRGDHPCRGVIRVAAPLYPILRMGSQFNRPSHVAPKKHDAPGLRLTRQRRGSRDPPLQNALTRQAFVHSPLVTLGKKEHPC